MTKQSDHISPELEQYLALCRRLYEKMVREDRWPWPDKENEPAIEGDSQGDTVSP